MAWRDPAVPHKKVCKQVKLARLALQEVEYTRVAGDRDWARVLFENVGLTEEDLVELADHFLHLMDPGFIPPPGWRA